MDMHATANELRKRTGECIYVSFNRLQIAVTSKVSENYIEGRRYSTDTMEIEESLLKDVEDKFEKLLLFTNRFSRIPESEMSHRDKLQLTDRLAQLLKLRGLYYEDNQYHYKGKVFYSKEQIINYIFQREVFKDTAEAVKAVPVSLEDYRHEVREFSYLSSDKLACVLDNTALLTINKETYDNLSLFLNDFAIAGYIDEYGDIKWEHIDKDSFKFTKTTEGNIHLLEEYYDEGIVSVLNEEMPLQNNGLTQYKSIYPIALLRNNKPAFIYEK